MMVDGSDELVPKQQM